MKAYTLMIIAIGATIAGAVGASAATTTIIDGNGLSNARTLAPTVDRADLVGSRVNIDARAWVSGARFALNPQPLPPGRSR